MSGDLSTTRPAAAVATRANVVPAHPRATLAREANAVFAIAWREILRAVKSPLSIAFTVIFPILFIGVLGGSIAQNLGGALAYAYLPFMLIGMVANTMYQGTIAGVTNLVERADGIAPETHGPPDHPGGPFDSPLVHPAAAGRRIHR